MPDHSVTAQTLIVDVPDNEWLTANGRRHWSDTARRTRALRTRAAFTARNQHLHPTSGRVRVIATITYPSARRADPANTAPTVKALIDGLTDAGVWEDDDSRHLIGPDFRRFPLTLREIEGACYTPGRHRVTLTIQEEP